MLSKFEDEIKNHGYIVYSNRGQSMMPLIREHRDLLIIEKPPKRCKKYDIVLYKRDDGAYILHRILKVRDKDYVICGDNCWKREYGITDKHIIGILTGIQRDGKTIPIDSKKLKIYAHIWCDLFPIRSLLFLTRAVLWKIRRLIKTH